MSSRLTCLCSAVSFPCAVAFAALPSLMPDETSSKARAIDDRRAATSSVLSRFESIGRGRIYLQSLGTVDYRFASQGLKASFNYAGATGSALAGYDGERRLELAWPVEGGRLKFAVGDEGGRSELRIELVSDF